MNVLTKYTEKASLYPLFTHNEVNIAQIGVVPKLDKYLLNIFVLALGKPI